MDLGAKYLEEQKYDEAISAYTEAIKIDDMSVEAYLGIAEAYIGKGDIETATEWLQKGYDVTGDKRLLDKYNLLLEENNNNTITIDGYNTLPLDDDKIKIVEKFLQVDSVQVRGKMFNTNTLCGLNVTQANNNFGTDITSGIEYETYELGDGFSISVYGDNEIILTGNDTVGNAIYNINGSYSVIRYPTGSRLATNSELNDVFQFLDSNGLDSINTIADSLIGTYLDDNTSLVIDFMNGVYCIENIKRSTSTKPTIQINTERGTLYIFDANDGEEYQPDYNYNLTFEMFPK